MKASVSVQQETVTLFVSDTWKEENSLSLQQELSEKISGAKMLLIDASGLKEWDSSLVVLLKFAIELGKKQNIPVKNEHMPEDLQGLMNLVFAVKTTPRKSDNDKVSFLERIGGKTITIITSCRAGCCFIGDCLKSLGHFIAGTYVMRKKDFWMSLEDAGPNAVAIVSLISFMVGLILAFVGALQLKAFGAEIYVASLVSIGMTRIMGAIMTGIIMAGRTGSSYAATIGSMQVNEELDALKTMGVSRVDFLFLPRFLALLIALPVLTALSDLMGILGGAFVGVVLLQIPYEQYAVYTADAFSMVNFWVGLFHGFIYGIVIALTGCYYGLNTGRNADSVGLSTTRAVVSAIVWMIVLTGVLTIIFEEMGI